MVKVKVKVAFTVLLMVSLLGIAACDDDDDDGGSGGTTTGAEEAGTDATEGGEPILIKTHLAPVNAEGETTGEVLSGSTIGDSAFCAGGSFADAAGEPPIESVVRTFRCPDGTLTIRFTTTPPDVKQRGDWKVVKGLVGFEGLSGGGRMRAVSESSGGEGREIFTGTVTP
jgi:hypothetical protein